VGRPRIYDWDEIRRLAAEGMPVLEIHKHIGCDDKLPYYVLNKDNPPPWETPEHRYAISKAYKERHRKPPRKLLTAEEVIAMIQEWVDWEGRLPRWPDWGNGELPNAYKVSRLFGTTRGAIEAAGYEFTPYKPMSKKRPKKVVAQAPCAEPGCTRNGIQQYSDFSANEAVSYCMDHYRRRIGALS
jgi:hypothetical protein